MRVLPPRPQRSASTVGFSPLRERNAEYRQHALVDRAGGDFVARAGGQRRCRGRTGLRARAALFESRKTSLAVAPSRLRGRLRAARVQRRVELHPVRQDRPRVDRARDRPRVGSRSAGDRLWPRAARAHGRARYPARRPTRGAAATAIARRVRAGAPARRLPRVRRDERIRVARDGRTGAPCPCPAEGVASPPTGSRSSATDRGGALPGG